MTAHRSAEGIRDKLLRKSREWQCKDGNDGLTEVMWPQDILVPLFGNARIATYSYESD